MLIILILKIKNRALYAYNFSSNITINVFIWLLNGTSNKMKQVTAWDLYIIIVYLYQINLV
jgi:hypothetical protein